MLMDSFREAIQGDNADVLFSALRTGLDDLADRINIIAENLPEAFEGVDLTGLLDAFGDLGGELQDAFTAVFGEIDLTTVEGLQEALQKNVDGFTALTNVTSGIIGGLKPLLRSIGAGVDEFQDLDSATQKSVNGFTAVSNGTSGIIGVLEPLFRAIGAGVDELQDLDSANQKSVSELLGLSKAIDTMLSLLGGLGSGLEPVGNGLTILAGA